jgi:pimeloyl-ACP methyl ester carboxylesterase
MKEIDLELVDGRMLHAYDAAPTGEPKLTLAWHHGSPQTGAPLPPVVAAAADRGIRVFSYGRPSYGGSSSAPGRDVASAAADLAAVADAFDIERFATMGASGGGPHALAAAALRPDRVVGVVLLASIAPYTDAFDWFDGMAAPAGIQSAFEGRAARAAFEKTARFDPTQFVDADHAALAGAWASLGEDVGRSERFGPDGLIDDDVSFATPWGFALEQVSAPVLVVHGALDRVVPPAHAEWLAKGLPAAELRIRPGDGHVSVLDAVPAAMDWLFAR